jgi:hypothetical protein
VPDSAEETVELPTDPSPPGPPPPAVPGRARSGFWAELSGALALGLGALAAAVLVFQLIAYAQGIPGPGLLTVGGHILAAAVALVVQRFADRLHGWPKAAAVLGVAVVGAVVLWVFWWA